MKTEQNLKCIKLGNKLTDESLTTSDKDKTLAARDCKHLCRRKQRTHHRGLTVPQSRDALTVKASRGNLRTAVGNQRPSAGSIYLTSVRRTMKPEVPR